MVTSVNDGYSLRRSIRTGIPRRAAAFPDAWIIRSRFPIKSGGLFLTQARESFMGCKLIFHPTELV